MEKYHPQRVSFNIDLIFNSPPKAITSDQLEDTVCYLQIIQNIQTLCTQRTFNLIEHLTFEVYKTIHDTLGNNRQDIFSVTVTLHKMAPPVPGIHGGVSFTYCGTSHLSGGPL